MAKTISTIGPFPVDARHDLSYGLGKSSLRGLPRQLRRVAAACPVGQFSPPVTALLNEPPAMRSPRAPRLDPPPPMPIDFSIGSVICDWHVAQTKSREEMNFARSMLNQGIGYFLPMEKVKRRQSNGKWQVYSRLLFPGYVFFCGGPMERYSAQATGRICRIIVVADQGQIKRELQNLEWAVGNDAHIVTNIKEGERARVRLGHALEGQEGLVETISGKGVVILRITILNTSAVLEIDPDFLEPI